MENKVAVVAQCLHLTNFVYLFIIMHLKLTKNKLNLYLEVNHSLFQLNLRKSCSLNLTTTGVFTPPKCISINGENRQLGCSKSRALY